MKNPFKKRIARLMNENFVNIKVDREERPDLDTVYMEAVQAITGSGGCNQKLFRILVSHNLPPFQGCDSHQKGTGQAI